MTSADAVARRAASRAGVSTRTVEHLEDLREAASLFDRVWGPPGGCPVVPVNVLRAAAHAGSYVAGAFDASDELVGAIAGFVGVHGSLHSHILAVEPSGQGAGVGQALKQHQRAWALEHGITTVRWTFDPLVRRNAFFNLQKLGAAVGAYLEDFYGPMNDSLNRDDPTDRLLVVWSVGGARAAAAAGGELPEPDEARLEAQGAQAVVEGTGDGGAAARIEVLAGSPRRILCATPGDIVTLRHQRPQAARAWRLAVRAALSTALTAGYEVEGMTRSGRYVLGARREPVG